KVQNAPLCIPIAIYTLIAAARTKRAVPLAGGIAVCLAGCAMYSSIQPATRVTAAYNSIFFGLLPQSDAPRSDLISLGLSPDYAQYVGTVAWSPGTGVADGRLVSALDSRTAQMNLMRFYLTHPARLFRRISSILPAAFSLRPEFCGNFEASAGRPPGAR